MKRSFAKRGIRTSKKWPAVGRQPKIAGYGMGRTIQRRRNFTLPGGSQTMLKQLLRPTPMPTRMAFNMTYGRVATLTGGAVGITGTGITFQLNSLYAPQTSGGHQPYGFDQMAALYSQYKVLSVDVAITFADPSVGTAAPVIQLRSSSDTFDPIGITPENFIEKPNSDCWVCDGVTFNRMNFTKHIEIADLEGESRSAFYNDTNRYVANVTGSPSSIPKLYVGVGDHGGNSSSTIVCKVQIVYNGFFLNRKTQTYS